MIDNQVQAADKQSSKNARHLRIAGIVILVAVLGYTVALLAGLPKERRLDATALGVIGIGSLVASLLFRPDIVDRVTRLEIAGWKVEIEKKEQKQDKQLFDIELILAILLPETERRHLMNLAGKRTTEYMGSHEMRSELRRLRSIGLIETKPGHTVGSMGDKTKLDLSEYVQLTDLGRRLVQNISDIEAQTASEAKAS